MFFHCCYLFKIKLNFKIIKINKTLLSFLGSKKRQMKNGVLVCKNYVIKKKLGQGAFGEIYLSFNENDKKEYAVKLEDRRCKYP